MSKSKSGVSNIRVIVYAYIIMIVVQLLLQVSRMLTPKVSFEMAAIGAMLFAWLLLLLGFQLVSSKGKEFKRGRLAALLGLLLTCAEAYYAFRSVKAGLGTETFIDIYVLFFWFLSICALLYTFAKALKGMQPIVEMIDERLASKYPRTALLVGTIVVLVLVFMPVMRMLPQVTGYIGTLTLGVVMALAQGYVCKLLLDGHHAVRANKDEAREAARRER